jgi:SAM-dependent methyltransferase
MGDSQYRTTDRLQARLRLHQRFATHQQGWFPWLHGEMELERFGSVLDVGCGDGTLWTHAPTLPGRVVAVDTSEAMARRTAERFDGSIARAISVLSSVQALPLPDERVDAAVANHMLYHAPDPPRALAELHRVLRRGGWLFASANGAGSMLQLHELIAWVRPDAPRARFFDVFGLENGPAMMARVFEHVELRRYPNRLEVTDAQAVVDYILSMDASSDLSADEQARIRERVQAEIDARGHFLVSTDAGLLVARKAMGTS